MLAGKVRGLEVLCRRAAEPDEPGELHEPEERQEHPIILCYVICYIIYWTIIFIMLYYSRL